MKKHSISNFLPEIWNPQNSDAPPILLCARRTFFGPKLKGASGDGHSIIGSPVAIALSSPVQILLDICVKDTSAKWQKLPLKAYGISAKAAAAALSEAWRFVKSYSLDGVTLAPQIVINDKIADSRLAKVIERNVAACLLWDSWNRQGLSREARAEILRRNGYDCTAKAIEKAIEEGAGLMIKTNP
ncbi:MAG: hypothetical protein WCP45_05315 [Verrucomicrobiota bacterium]